MNSRKEQIKEKIKEMEQDMEKFKNEVREKQLQSFQMMQDVEGVKSKMREEMLKDMIEFQEELMIQNERLVEIGQKLYYNQNFMERKFVQNGELEIKLNALNEIVSQLEFNMEKIKFSMKKRKQMIKDTEVHVKKFMPMQLATFVFDAMFNIIESSRDQQACKDYFTPIFEAMERQIKKVKDTSAPFISNDFNFEKLQYKIPSSFHKPILSDRSVRKGDRDKRSKNGKDSKSKDSGGLEPPRSSKGAVSPKKSNNKAIGDRKDSEFDQENPMLSKSDIAFGIKTPDADDSSKTPGASKTNNDRNVMEKNFISFNQG